MMTPAILPKLIILDRDGVINYDSPDYIKSAAEWIPIESSLQAIKLLNRHNIKVAIASNQRGIGLGLYTEEALSLITAKMHTACAQVGAYIDSVRYCPALERTHPDHKPNPGMLLSIMDELNLSPLTETIYFVGDKVSDVQAALHAKCTPILVETGYGQNSVSKAQAYHRDILIYPDLLSFVKNLLRND